MLETVKFGYIVLCLCVALGSYFFRHNRSDWGLLAGALIFTAAADYFLVLHDAHLEGIALFCYAHMLYIMRAMNTAQIKHRYLYAIAGPNALAVIFILQGWVIAFVGLYAALFLFNICVTVKLRRVIPNGLMVLTGLFLFALCDINVLLYNLPRYFGIFSGLRGTYPLIWLFYIPAQGLLAGSAIDFAKLRRMAHEP
jgi:hypothetical protein